MKKAIFLSAFILLIVLVYSCRKSTDKLSTTAYLDLPATPYNYQGFFADSTANYKGTLGRVLFYDAHLSVNNAISCASCHKQALGFADDKALSEGYEGKLTKRNSIGINMSGEFGLLFWDGRESNIQNLALRPLTNHVEMGIDDMDALAAKLSQLSYYGPLFKDAYGDEQVTPDRISSALSSFMMTITARNSRFDAYQDGNQTALSALELEGATLFNNTYQCSTCHNNGFGYRGGQFLDIGLNNAYTDLGRGAITGTQADMGKFRIPDLHNVALTAPYMHDGRYKTLGECIDHYSHGICNSPNLDSLLKNSSGGPIAMSIPDHDKEALIAFLGSMTDYQVITDPRFSNPFKVK